MQSCSPSPNRPLHRYISLIDRSPQPGQASHVCLCVRQSKSANIKRPNLDGNLQSICYGQWVQNYECPDKTTWTVSFDPSLSVEPFRSRVWIWKQCASENICLAKSIWQQEDGKKNRGKVYAIDIGWWTGRGVGVRWARTQKKRRKTYEGTVDWPFVFIWKYYYM